MKRGDVVLVYVPFVGAKGGKRRPAVVVQNDSLNAVIRETVVVKITSNVSRAGRPHHVLIEVATPDEASTGLLTDSVIRCERPHTVPQADILKTIGALSPMHLQWLDEATVHFDYPRLRFDWRGNGVIRGEENDVLEECYIRDPERAIDVNLPHYPGRSTLTGPRCRCVGSRLAPQPPERSQRHYLPGRRPQASQGGENPRPN